MKWISADYIKELMKNDRLMQGNAEYKLWEQEVEKKVDAMPSIDVMDVATAYRQGWCDALDASISALNDAKFQLGKLHSTADTPQTEQPTALSNALKEFEKDAEWLEQVGASSISLEEYKQRTSAILKRVDYTPDTPQTEKNCDNCGSKTEACYFCDGECNMWTPQTDCGWK